MEGRESKHRATCSAIVDSFVATKQKPVDVNCQTNAKPDTHADLSYHGRRVPKQERDQQKPESFHFEFPTVASKKDFLDNSKNFEMYAETGKQRLAYFPAATTEKQKETGVQINATKILHDLSTNPNIMHAVDILDGILKAFWEDSKKNLLLH